MKMKFLLPVIIALAALLVSPIAQAQHSADPLTLGGTPVLGGTNNSPALTTNVYDTVSVTRGQNAALQVQFIGPASSTSNIVVRIDTSLDGPDTQTLGSTNWFQN